jgi:ketosteroid isomerase-like protein
MAGHHDAAQAEVTAAAEAFNTAYSTNDVDTYFGFYTEDAVLFFYGARQPVAAYKRGVDSID